MRISGNKSVQAVIRSEFGKFKTNSISGYSNIGKFTFINELSIELVGPNDVLAVEPNVDGTRAAIEFASYYPSFGAKRVVIINDAHTLSDSAQDAYLKMCEDQDRLFGMAGRDVEIEIG